MPTPSFNYENLGLALKVTPTVHGREEVTLDVDAEYKVLSGVYVNGMPVIASRVLKSKARLRFGEWAAVAGLLDEQEAKTVAGLAGLSRIPLLAPLFAKHDRNKSAQEVFILMRPYLLSAPASEKPPKTLSLGSETRPLTRF
jgi:type II secretory pathway component GspD/PulD (secretin)